MFEQEPNLEDIVTIPVKCKGCGGTGEAYTLKQILEKKDSLLVKQLEEHGYVESTCDACVQEEESE